MVMEGFSIESGTIKYLISSSILYFIIPSSEINKISLDKILKALKYLKEITGISNRKNIIKNNNNLKLYEYFVISINFFFIKILFFILIILLKKTFIFFYY